jgi:hypothetical protein
MHLYIRICTHTYVQTYIVYIRRVFNHARMSRSIANNGKILGPHIPPRSAGSNAPSCQSCRRASEMRAAAFSTNERIANMPRGGRARGGLARSGADASRASDVAMQMWHRASPVRPRMGSKTWDVEYARRQSCLGDVPWRSQWSFLPRQARAPSHRTCAPNAASLRWRAVAVSPSWQPTHPNADAAQAEPSPGADLKSDPAMAWTGDTGACHRHCARREGRPRCAATIDAIGLVTGRWMVRIDPSL